MRTLIRRGTVTDIRARNQMFGGEPFLGVSPYLENGPDDRTQNARNNFQTLIASNSGTSGTSSTALSNIPFGNRSAPRWSNFICTSGAYTFDLVQPGDGKKRLLYRCEYNDPDASGQGAGGGRKSLMRTGATKTEISNGLGKLGSIGDTEVWAFSFAIPAASYAKWALQDYTLIWQYKNDDANRPPFDINICNNTYRGNNASPPGAGTAGAPCVLIRQTPGLYTEQVRAFDNVQPDEPLFFIERITYGFAPWVSAAVTCRYEIVTSNGNLYQRPPYGDASVIAQGAVSATASAHGTNAPSHGSGDVADNAGVVWRYLGPVPAGNQAPRIEVWAARGMSAPYGKVFDSSRSNLTTFGDYTERLAHSWGIYTRGTGDDNSQLASPWWGPGDALTLHQGDVLMQRMSQAPNATALSAWFATMRARF